MANINEKLDRSITSLLALGEEIVLLDEKWVLYPLTGIESSELRVWLRGNPPPQASPEIQPYLGPDALEKPNGLQFEISRFSESVEEWNYSLFFYVLWLSLRKNCMTPQEIRNSQAERQWLMSENDVRMLVPVDQLEGIVERVFRFLGIRVIEAGD